MQHVAAEHNNARRETAAIAKLGVLGRSCACGNHKAGGGECETCNKKSKGMLQPKAFDSNDVTVPPIVHDVLNSPGEALNSQTRAFMEPRFSHDFSRVRVHTDSKAAESAKAVNALAYTVGRDVVFGAGKYAPATREGRRLLAHELTHVEQQSHISTLGNEPLRVSTSGSGEAEANSNAAMIDAATPLRTATQHSIHQIQRRPIGAIDDPIHGGLIEEWRKRHGFPPGGKDPEGNQAGPTDAEIKYGGLLMEDQKPGKPSQPKFDPASFVGSLGILKVTKDGVPTDWKMAELAKKAVEALIASPNAYIQVTGSFVKGDTEFDPDEPTKKAQSDLIQEIRKLKHPEFAERVTRYWGGGGPFAKGVGGEIRVEVKHSSLGPNAISPGPSPKPSDDKPKKAGEEKAEEEEGGLETKINIIPVEVSIPYKEGDVEAKQKVTLEIAYKIRPIAKTIGKKVEVSWIQFQVAFEGGVAKGQGEKPGESVTIPIAEAGIAITIIEVKIKGPIGKLPNDLKISLGVGVTGDIVGVKAEPKGELKIEGKFPFLKIGAGAEGVVFSIGVNFDLVDLFKRKNQ